MKPAWDYVTTVESESEPGVTHDIKQRRADGHLGCDCMSYRFAPKAAKSCKHIKAFVHGKTGLDMIRLADTLAAARQRVVTQTETFVFSRRRAITFGDIPVGR